MSASYLMTVTAAHAASVQLSHALALMMEDVAAASDPAAWPAADAVMARADTLNKRLRELCDLVREAHPQRAMDEAT